MRKKLIALFLSALMIFSFAPLVFAAVPGDTGLLKFDENGKFKIMYICDVQDTYPIHKTSTEFITAMLNKYKPDLAILGGDNTVAPKETKKEAIKELCDLFVNTGTYFSLVFGNHDHQHEHTNDELFAFYKLYGGEYCLAYDAEPALSGCATHNLVIMSSDNSKIAYNLYMFDSHDSVHNEKGETLGYGCVQKDQIEWYKNTSAAIKELNGGKTAPAMAFQHIVVQEIYDELYPKMSPMGELSRNYDGRSYALAPNLSKIKKGFLYELPCPGYYNYGQFDAFKETGDIVAVFSGHDHINTYTVEKDGIDIVNTPGCTFYSYGNHITRGCRLIELDEKDLSTYSSKVLTISEYVLGEGKKLTKYGDVNMFEAFFSVVIQKANDVLIAILNFLSFKK